MLQMRKLRLQLWKFLSDPKVSSLNSLLAHITVSLVIFSALQKLLYVTPSDQKAQQSLN